MRQRAVATAVVAVVCASLWTAGAGTAGAGTPGTAAATGRSTGPVSAAVVPNGAYRIRNVASPGHCLQLESRDLTEGPLVGMVPCSNNARQLWDVAGSFDATYYFIRNRTGGCLDADVQGGKPTFVAHVIPCWGTNNPHQLWTLPSAGNGGIMPLAYSPFPRRQRFVLDNSLDSAGGFGFRVNYWRVTGTNNQLFSLERMSPF